MLMLVMLGAGITACADPAAPGPVVLVIQDGVAADARDVVTPGVLGLELGLEGSGLSIRIVEATELDPAEQVADERVVAAVIAPFTEPTRGSIATLRGGGVVVISLSELTPPGGSAGAPMRAFVPPFAAQAEAMEAVAGCVAGDGSSWSTHLQAALPSAIRLEGGPPAVAVEAGSAGCTGVAWTGAAAEATTLAGLLARSASDATLVVSSRARTPGFAEQVPVELIPVGLCPCVDLTTSVDPEGQRFLHGYQTANGLDPGPLAAEGFDAGRMLAALAQPRPGRVSIAEALAATSRYEGLGGPYVWDDQGGLVEPLVRMYERVGLRWVEPVATRVAG